MNETDFIQQVDTLIHSYQNQLSSFANLSPSFFNILKKGKRYRSKFLFHNPNIQSSELKIRFATYIELIHAASLVHDDIIDQSHKRRGLPTLNSLFPISIPISCGFYLFSKIITSLLGESNSFYNPICSTLRKMSLGQIYEINNQCSSLLSYLRIISYKTASLFSLASGLTEEGFSQNEGKVGFYFGLAFQITDDLLDFAGNAQVADKPIHLDEMTGVLTLPLMLEKKGMTKDMIIEQCKTTIMYFVKQLNNNSSAKNYKSDIITLKNYYSSVFL